MNLWEKWINKTMLNTKEKMEENAEKIVDR